MDFPKVKKKRPSYLNIHWINEKIITVENKVNVLEVKWGRGEHLKTKQNCRNGIHEKTGNILNRYMYEI